MDADTNHMSDSRTIYKPRIELAHMDIAVGPGKLSKKV